jgi:hypothetical protein
VVFYLAVSLGIQRVVVQERANRLQAGRPVTAGRLAGIS